MDLIFKYFQQRDYWNIKDLNEYTRQPIVYLKEVLNEVCLYHNSGPNKGLYELKPELRTTPKKSESGVLPQSSQVISNTNVTNK
jgi:transcription initiation factor TFIIF subunit beta